MTESTRERQRIVEMIGRLRDEQINTPAADQWGNSIRLAWINAYQQCIDKIMEATDE